VAGQVLPNNEREGSGAVTEAGCPTTAIRRRTPWTEDPWIRSR